MINLSFSKISTWRECQFQYYCKYVLLIKSPSTVWQLFGSTIHQVLEDSYVNNITSKLEMVAYFRKLIEGTELNKDFFRKDGEKILYQFPITDFKKDVIGVEHKFKVKLSDEVNLVGVIDRVDKLDDNTLLLTDYKTNSAVDLKPYILQMQLYDYATSIDFPEYENRVLDWFYLRFNKHNKVTVPLEVNQMVKSKCLEIADEINNATDYTKTANKYCKWCQVKDKCRGK